MWACGSASGQARDGKCNGPAPMGDSGCSARRPLGQIRVLPRRICAGCRFRSEWCCLRKPLGSNRLGAMAGPGLRQASSAGAGMWSSRPRQDGGFMPGGCGGLAKGAVPCFPEPCWLSGRGARHGAAALAPMRGRPLAPGTHSCRPCCRRCCAASTRVAVTTQVLEACRCRV